MYKNSATLSVDSPQHSIYRTILLTIALLRCMLFTYVTNEGTVQIFFEDRSWRDHRFFTPHQTFLHFVVLLGIPLKLRAMFQSVEF